MFGNGWFSGQFFSAHQSSRQIRLLIDEAARERPASVISQSGPVAIAGALGTVALGGGCRLLPRLATDDKLRPSVSSWIVDGMSTQA